MENHKELKSITRKKKILIVIQKFQSQININFNFHTLMRGHNAKTCLLHTVFL